MKLINMSCPQCGADIEIDGEAKFTACKYCGAKLMFDDEAQHIQYDNAEEAGYKFEKGRQRAQNEMSNIGYSTGTCPRCHGNKISFKRESAGTRGYHKTVAICKNCGNTWTVSTDIPQAPPKAKKRHTWLWVIGWICMFPVPLTILMLRNKELNKNVRIGIIAIAWIAYLIFGIVGNLNDSNEASNSSNSTTSEQPVSSESSTEVLTESVENGTTESDSSDSDSYADLDAFIESFNSISDIKIISQEKIDIQDKTSDYYRVEFRLSAYNNAAAYHILFDDNSSADVVDTVDYFSGTTIDGSISRIYVSASSKEAFKSLFLSACNVAYSEIADSEVDETIKKMLHPDDDKEMEYLYCDGSGLVGDVSYTYDIKEKDSSFQFFLDYE